MKKTNSPKLVVVTGGTRGIGLAIATALAANGYDLELWFCTRCPENSLIDALVAAGANSVVLRQVDVSNRDTVKQALEGLKDKAVRLWGLVNNAGILQQKPFETLTDHDWDRMLSVNLKGAFICAQEAMPLMEKGGSVVNIASSGGQLGGMLAVHYSVSKAGVIALTKSLARVGAESDIRVNCVAPGLIETEMTTGEISSVAGQEKINQLIPMRRVGAPQEVANTVKFLLSDEAAYITGQTLNVNGGLYMG